MSADAVLAVIAVQKLVDACKGKIAAFPANPTLIQMQEYAECVQVLYPADTSVFTLLMKALFVLALVGMVGAGYKLRKEQPAAIIVGSLIGFFLLPAIALFIGGVFWGVWWLFT